MTFQAFVQCAVQRQLSYIYTLLLDFEFEFGSRQDVFGVCFSPEVRMWYLSPERPDVVISKTLAVVRTSKVSRRCH